MNSYLQILYVKRIKVNYLKNITSLETINPIQLGIIDLCFSTREDSSDAGEMSLNEIMGRFIAMKK